VSERIGIIPAGGKGSRLAPYPSPKELFPIGWQPYDVNGEIHRRPKVVSQYALESMTAAGVTRIFFVLGENKHDIMRYYGNGSRFGTNIAYLYQESAEGMVHAIDLAYPWTSQSTILFGMADTIIYPPDAFTHLLSFHFERNAEITLGLFSTDRPSKFGMVATDEHSRIVFHVDKPKETPLKLMWGLAVCGPAFTDLLHSFLASGERLSKQRELVLGDVFDKAIKRGMRILGFHFRDGLYIDIGTYDEIVEAQQQISEIQR
jgi:glucose-1-phosphate thymidylyltransferase